MSESSILSEIEAACSHHRICVLPRNPKKLYCSVWSMPDTKFHIGVIWRQNVGGFEKGRSFIRLGQAGLADFTGFLFGSGRRLEIEVKTDTGELNGSQEAFRDLALSAGILYGVARSYDGCCKLLEGWGLKANG